MARYVAYYRPRSGPGRNKGDALRVQRERALAYVRENGELVGEFTEDEGQNQKRRPHLEHAINAARRKHAALIIPRFEAISRDPAFIERLSGLDIKIIALDIENIDDNGIAVLAEAAENKRAMLSARVRAGLEGARATGVRLGNPRIRDAQKKATEAAKRTPTKRREAILPEVRELRERGLSLRAIAEQLNLQGVQTVRGRKWYASSVRNVLRKVSREPQ